MWACSVRTRSRFLCATFPALLVFAQTATTSIAYAADSTGVPLLELGAYATFVSRSTPPRGPDNARGVTYDPAAGLRIDARANLFQWLGFAIIYHRSSHTVSGPDLAPDLPGHQYTMETMATYAIGAAVEPTYRFSDRMRAWLSIGAGWGRAKVGKTSLTTATGTHLIDERAGVFVELPLGAGFAYDVIRNHVSVVLRGTRAGVTAESGSLYETTQTLDSRGQISHEPGLPTFSPVYCVSLGLAWLI